LAAGDTLNAALVEGRIDALIAPRAPSAYTDRHPLVARLFPDFRGVEKAYHAKTGIFPIMHVVGVRAELVQQQPWLAASVLKAFTQAKNIALRDLAEVAALKATLPWLASEYEESVAALGKDYWPYGVPGNEPALNAFLRYHHRQGLSARAMCIDDLFAASTLEEMRL
jgi:4,5-dihydroxyphthalate decarboxylase